MTMRLKDFTAKSFPGRLTLTALAVAVVLSLSACGGAGSGEGARFGTPPETLVRPDIGIGGHIKRVAPALR
ncbi:MAG: hypothetical protein OXF42_00585 [Candidatus Dadabacteria bacterium]|nr:hypothetical protein [Candidatus Dadabacteria bacterium]